MLQINNIKLSKLHHTMSEQCAKTTKAFLHGLNFSGISFSGDWHRCLNIPEFNISIIIPNNPTDKFYAFGDDFKLQTNIITKEMDIDRQFAEQVAEYVKIDQEQEKRNKNLKNIIYAKEYHMLPHPPTEVYF